MKKYTFLFLGIFSLLMITCSNPFESEKESEKQSVISEARAYFETNASDLLPLTFPDRRLSTKTSSLSFTELTPLWDKAYETNHNGVQFVEVPLASKTQFICVETVKRVAGADPEKRIPCQRLLVIANTTLGKEMYVATLVPSEAYLAQTKNWTVEPRTEKGELLGFSGRVFYSTLKGVFKRAVAYRNGVLGDDYQILKSYGFAICLEKNTPKLSHSIIRFAEENSDKDIRTYALTKTNANLEIIFDNLLKNTSIGVGGIGVNSIGNDYEGDSDYEMGLEGIEQITSDIATDRMYTYRVENGVAYGDTNFGTIENKNNFKTACFSCLANVSPENIRLFGAWVKTIVAAVSLTRAIIAFSDCEVSEGDMIEAVRALLDVAAAITAFIPSLWLLSGVLTITSVMFGLVATNQTQSMLIHVPLKNSKNMYFYIPAMVNSLT